MEISQVVNLIVLVIIIGVALYAWWKIQENKRLHLTIKRMEIKDGIRDIEAHHDSIDLSHLVDNVNERNKSGRDN